MALPTTTNTQVVVTQKQIFVAHFFLIYQQLTSITTYTLGKMIMGLGMSSIVFVFIRLGVALPFMLGASYFVTRKWFPERKHLLWMILSGVVVVGAQTLLNFGLVWTTATNASIINAPCVPLFTTALSILRGSDKMTISKAFGFSVSLGGALILLEIEKFSFEGKALGNLVVIVSSFLNACNTVIQRKVLDDGAHPITTIAYTTLYGLIGFVAVFSHLGLFNGQYWHMSTVSMVEMIMVGTVCTVVPWVGGGYALKNTSPMTVSIYVVLQPPLAAVVGLALGETFTWHQPVGCVLVLFGLVFVLANNKLEAWLLQLYYHLVPSHKNFEVLKNSSDDSKEIVKDSSNSSSNVEMKEMSVIIMRQDDGADETIYEFKEQPTNSMLDNAAP